MKESTNRTLISNPKSIICIGLNYADHIAETSLATHDFPEIFMKTSNALASNHGTITIEDESFHYDYEGELVIIIGKSGKNIKFVYINNSQVSQWLCDSDINTYTVFGDRKIPVFFGRMLSGGIDSFSRLRLVNEIKDYLNRLESKIEK